MIDPITLHILQEQGMIEGYNLKCALCGKVVEIVQDGEGPLSCCNKRMFVMSGSPEPASESNIQPFTEQEEQEFFERLVVEKIVLNRAADYFERLDILESKEHLTEEELLELKKTRNILQRAVDTVATTGYAKRKRDLMRLRKKTTPAMRKKLKDAFKSTLKKKPGLATLAAKAKKIKGLTKTQGAALRREVGKRLGGDVAGYTKMGRIKDREWVKQKERGRKAKKAIRMQKKETKRQQKTAIKYYKKHGRWPGAAKKKVKKAAPSSGQRKYKSSEDKRFSGTSGKKEEFNPGAFMSAESVELNTELDRLIAECEADFSPYNQPETQNKVETDREERFDDERKANERIKKKVSEATDNKESRIDKFMKKVDKWSKEGTLIKKYVPYEKRTDKKKVSEAEGMKGLPKGWTQDSIKKFSKSLTGKEGTKEGFFKKCVARMKDKMENPEGFCASIKDELHGSTYWRGKGKTPQQAGKDVKAHPNVKRG